MPCGVSKTSNQTMDHSDKNGENQHCAFQDLDHSVLQHPMHSGVKNVKQILKCLQDASKEVKDIILNECNIIYECKVCASLFRGLANFMYHKRCYCKNHLCEEMVLFNNFEEETVVVQPEPPNENISLEKETIPKLLRCTVDLVKADIKDEKFVPMSNNEGMVNVNGLKQKTVPNKSSKIKEQVEKKCTEAKKAEHSMVSRRTRDKNSQKQEKKNAKNTKIVTGPTKTVRKIDKEATASETVIETLTNNLKVVEYVDMVIENEIAVNIQTDVEKEVVDMQTDVEKEPAVNMEINVDNEIIVNTENDTKRKVAATLERDKVEEITGTMEINKVRKEIFEGTIGIDTIDKVVESTIGTNATDEVVETTMDRDAIDEVIENTMDTCIIDKMVENTMEKNMIDKVVESTMEIDEIGESVECTGEIDKLEKSVESNMETNKVEKENSTIDKIEDIDIHNLNKSEAEILKNSDILKENTELDGKPDDSSNIVLQPLKKIFLAKPRTIQLKNSVVLDSIRQKLKTDGNVGLTRIAQSSAKNVHFPKLILKTIDGNPHAVFQTTNKKQADSSNAVQSKTDNEKLIIVLKKDSLATEKQDKTSPGKEVKQLKSTEFHHMTRRKRLLARSDCDVHELKCLTCNTIFTSLKTLYFHMLSIHSKKRLYYPCPLCKTLFVQMYGVTRHLVSIHNKTKDQINKLRDVIKKKSVWKKVDDVNTSNDGMTVVDKTETKEESELEVKIEPVTKENNSTEASTVKTIIKLNKNLNFHQCSKCNRVFGRKSSQVSHEKFCIMNAIKVETVDLTAATSPTSPPVISFLSFQKKNAEANKSVQLIKSSEVKTSIRPKRRAEKQMHKDFVNSQTLKWRSVNRVTNPKVTVAPSVKKCVAKNLEKKVSNIMSVENLTCLKCGKTFSSYSNLKRHVAIHVGWTRFKCKYCEYQAYNKSQCWFHIQKTHDISEDEIDKFIQDLGSNWLTKKAFINRRGRPPKTVSTGNDIKKSNTVPKLKITKKKNIEMKSPEKKSQVIKKDNLDGKKDSDFKREKSLDFKKEIIENKKIQSVDGKKELNDIRKERSQSIDIKLSDLRKAQSISAVYKCSVPEYKKDLSNYKSLTTNNPTTIILSKKLPTSSVQSVVTIPTEPQSSNLANKTFPLRSSPRKTETKSPEGKGLTSLVTRSTAYAKSSIQITPPRLGSTENAKKALNQYSEKPYAKKEKLISEWFPKKDLNSNTSRRESAPLIIGLVPASGSTLSVRTKNPAISYEKNTS